MTLSVRAIALRRPSSSVVRRTVAVALGTALIAAGAQLAVPLPGTVVPLTFQVPALLIVGGLLGPGLGAASAVLYLGLGISGVPVFAPMPAAPFHVFGPTGGYLLAFPVAATVTGLGARSGRLVPLIAGLLGALAVIYAGGVAQLTALGGDLSVALAVGVAPFVIGDVLKVLFAGLLIWRFRSSTKRALT